MGNKKTMVPVSSSQLNRALGSITQITLCEGERIGRDKILTDPHRRGVEGWPLFGRVAGVMRKAALKCDGERGRMKLAALEHKMGEEHRMMTSPNGKRMEDWQPRIGKYYKQDAVVDLASVWSIGSNAYEKYKNNNAALRVGLDGRPGSFAIALADKGLPEEKRLGAGEAAVLSWELEGLEKLRSLRFMVNPAQIELLSEANGRAKIMGKGLSPAEIAFSQSGEMQNAAWMFFARELAGGNGHARAALEGGVRGRQETFGNTAALGKILEGGASGAISGRQAFELVKDICAPGKPLEEIKFNGLIVLDTKNRISDKFYYSLHAVTDYYGGLFRYWFDRFMDGKIGSLPGMDASEERERLGRKIADAEKRLSGSGGGFGKWRSGRRLASAKKELARLEEIVNPERRKRAEESFEVVKRKCSALINFYEIPGDCKVEEVPIFGRASARVKLGEGMVPERIRKVLGEARHAYAKAMLPNRFYMQNLATLRESLLLILAGLGTVKIFEKMVHGVSGIPGGAVAVFGEVLANTCNGIADMLSGAVRTGPKGEGAEQAKAEHASKGALVWGLIGGAITAGLNLKAVSTAGAHVAQSFFHSLSGNFTTQTVSQFGVWNGLFRKTARTLQKVGLIEKKVSTNWESFKEVNLYNIFRLWQTVIGSIALWTSSFAIGMLGIIEDPSKAGAFGGMLLFFTAVLETPLAAVGIGLTPMLNRRKVGRELAKAITKAEAKEGGEKNE